MKLKNLLGLFLVVGFYGLLHGSLSERDKQERLNKVVILLQIAQNNLGVRVCTKLDGHLNNQEFQGEVGLLLESKQQSYLLDHNKQICFEVGVMDQDPIMFVTAFEIQGQGLCSACLEKSKK